MSVADMIGMGPRREVTDNADGTWTIKVTPPEWVDPDAKAIEVKLTTDQYGRYKVWRSGQKMIQEALPDLSSSAREALMTGIVD